MIATFDGEERMKGLTDKLLTLLKYFKESKLIVTFLKLALNGNIQIYELIFKFSSDICKFRL